MNKINTLNPQYYEITPSKKMVGLNLGEIWKFKELLYIFIWRNLKIRYKQTVLGISWVIFQPLLSMIIFTVFFGKLIKIPSDNVPYPIFVYAGLIFWNYFNFALLGSLNSLIEGQGIIKKIYFPRLIIPLATTITPFVDFILVYIIFFGLMALYGFVPHLAGILWTPVLLLMAFMSATGLGLLLASINVKYRDVQYILSFFIQVLFFVTPIIYPISIIPPNYQWIIYLNPMAGIVILIRSLLLGTSDPNWLLLISSAGLSIFLFLLGLFYFRRSEQFFADEL